MVNNQDCNAAGCETGNTVQPLASGHMEALQYQPV
jgi:hypothetical protein